MFAHGLSRDSSSATVTPDLKSDCPASGALLIRNRFVFKSFDKEYVQRLTDCDPDTERHFTEYFGQLLGIKLRARLHAASAIEDIRQDTFLRVLTVLRKKRSLRSPEHLGAFVNAVCNKCLLEYYRDQSRKQYSPSEDESYGLDERMSTESVLVNAERMQQVREVLSQLRQKDRELLQMTFYSEKNKDEICRQFGTNQHNLRVLLHRAKTRFKQLLLERHGGFGKYPN